VAPLADLVIPAADAAALREIAAWDGFRPATFPASDFPVDVVRFEGSSSPPVALSRGRREASLKALPAGLRGRAEAAFARSGRPPRRLRLGHGKWLDLAAGPVIMGVVNVTPDSFSDGGVHFDRERAVEAALSMFEQGASIVDIGGESTRPSGYGLARELPAEEELARVLPVVAAVRARTDRPLSIDTRKASVAREAVTAGADLVNDVSAGRFDPEMDATIARAGAGAILMHMKGTDPRTMQDDIRYGHPLADVASFLSAAASRLIGAGVDAEAIAIDPGLGFGKSPEGNLTLLRHLSAFASLGFPVAVGASRKAFIRRFSGVGEGATPVERLPGSLAALAAAAAGRAAIVRVHDVADSVRFLRMLRAIAGEPSARPAPAGATAS
jgi:dihydropteroate synthase